MTWLKKVPIPHDCGLPRDTSDAHIGSIWECGVCKEQWTIHSYIENMAYFVRRSEEF